MLLQSLKMLLMNLTVTANLTGITLLIDTGFGRYLFVATYCEFEQVSSLTVETAKQCMKSVQSIKSIKNHQDIILTS